MSTNLQMDYSQMRTVGAKFLLESHNVRNRLSALNSETSLMMGTWQGSTQQIFQEEFNASAAEFMRTPIMLYQVGEALVNTADAFATYLLKKAGKVTVTCHFQAKFCSKPGDCHLRPPKY
jgi:WXG100 family type VII secretion target